MSATDRVPLGRSGLRVERIALGTMNFGGQNDEDEARAILDRADEAGIDLLDLADVYPLGGDLAAVGRTEEIVGRWLRGRRDRFVVATKCGGRTGEGPSAAGNGRDHVIAAVEASLRRLGTDTIDLYQLHYDDLATPLDETLDVLDELVRAGKVRAVGCSNFFPDRLELALDRAVALGLVPFCSVQPRYSLVSREIEREMLPLCVERGIAVLPYNPLAGGLLTGKHRFGSPPPSDSRFGLAGRAGTLYSARYWHEQEFATVERLRVLAADAGLTMTTLAVAWTLATPAITAPIIGASRSSQLDDVVAATSVVLDDDLLDELDALTEPYRQRAIQPNGPGAPIPTAAVPIAANDERSSGARTG